LGNVLLDDGTIYFVLHFRQHFRAKVCWMMTRLPDGKGTWNVSETIKVIAPFVSIETIPVAALAGFMSAPVDLRHGLSFLLDSRPMEIVWKRGMSTRVINSDWIVIRLQSTKAQLLPPITRATIDVSYLIAP
jgi:hypothetical protein